MSGEGVWDDGGDWDDDGVWDDHDPRRILIGRHDWMQDAGVVLSGGSWALPLENMIDPRPQIVAEAVTSRDWSATKFDVDLGRQRKVDLLHFQNIRATSLATVRIRAGTDPTFVSTALDTGWTTFWPRDKEPFSIDPWGVFTGSGVIDADEFAGLGLPRLFVPPATMDARYIRVEIKDAAAVSPLQIGCFSACDAWQPPLNFAYGWSLTVLDDSDVNRVPYGSTYITPKGLRRRMDLGFPALASDELYSRALGLALAAGLTNPIIIVPFPDDTEKLEKTAIRGLVSNASQISNPYFAIYDYPLQVEQLI